MTNQEIANKIYSSYSTAAGEENKEEAKKLYPHKGRYVLKGTVLTYIGDV